MTRTTLIRGAIWLLLAGLLLGAALVGIAVRAPDSYLGANLRSFSARYVPPLASLLRGLDRRPLAERLAGLGFKLGQPALLRIYKDEGELELWLDRGQGFEKTLTFPICRWSGTLGPKLKEGDGQSPEGFYAASKRQLKPDSNYYRAINVGFPNAFDRQLGRTGSFLMIHGACGSVGCYAMTDRWIDDIYTAVEQALGAGQPDLPIHIFPFRMTEANLARRASSPWAGYWANLAEGDRLFQSTRRAPLVAACGGRYAFGEAGTAPGCTRIAGW